MRTGWLTTVQPGSNHAKPVRFRLSPTARSFAPGAPAPSPRRPETARIDLSVRAGVECTGSCGAALTRHLRAEGIEVTEVNQPDKAARRRHGKADAVDAEAAARAVLSGRATASAKTSDGPVEMLRLFKLAKGSAIKSRTLAINQLKSVLVSADATLRESLAGLTNPLLFKRCAELEALDTLGPAAAAHHTLRLLARRIQHLTEEIKDLNMRITEAVKVRTPGLLEVNGVGPDSAAVLLIAAGDNPERVDSEASFAALCGTSPVEASSGKTQRRRGAAVIRLPPLRPSAPLHACAPLRARPAIAC
ncbi:transposase [Streptomyces sp. NBC_00365]|uniref:IS110 family transposase n=1 Tax=Streptomyces sp. NBC_00365 TaxID=2975726 RepID=UPI00224C909A|nr:transposase [Streptomyces sp. NBC_00365]MCX5097263.1 transposase [Streptomyces sp. NBC_00365]